MANSRAICSLARQLGSSLLPEVRNAVIGSLRENEDVEGQKLDEQFKSLLVAPFAKLRHQHSIILIIVDALDECDNAKDAADLINLIDRYSPSLPPNVKFLLTCRPEAAILRALESRGWRVEDLDSSVDVVNDLTRFIKQTCVQIRKDHGLPEEWPAFNDVAILVEMSQGLFQWVRTAITYISNGSPADRLRNLLKRRSAWSGLDGLYHQILSEALHNVRLEPARQELILWVLGALVVASHPVSLKIIAALYGSAETSGTGDQENNIHLLHQDILSDLSSLILIPTSPIEHMHLMHPSIRDVLVDEQQCKGRVYHIDFLKHHKRLAGSCLGIMVRYLKENICSLSDYSKANLEIEDVVEREMSKTIRYCCRAWSIHLTEGTRRSMLSINDPDGLLRNFEIFSKEKILYWLEVMSLVGATTEALTAAKRVHQWLLVRVDYRLCYQHATT